MTTRDWEYIESRLLAPCAPAMEAHERLRNHTNTPGLAHAADRLMYAMREFTETCRSIRYEINEELRNP